jgi:hypothetical protein
MGLVARYRRDVSGRTDEELIAEAGRLPHIRNPLELTSRLISSNKELRSELVKSRESSERLTAELSEQITRLTDELKNFRESSDTLSTGILSWSRILAALTVVLIVGTVILIPDGLIHMAVFVVALRSRRTNRLRSPSACHSHMNLRPLGIRYQYEHQAERSAQKL